MNLKLFSIFLLFLNIFSSEINLNEEKELKEVKEIEEKEEIKEEIVKETKPIKIKRNKKKTTDWNKLSENELEKEWEKGDDSVELEHEFERIQRIQAKKSKKMSNVLDSNDPAQIAKL